MRTDGGPGRGGSGAWTPWAPSRRAALVAVGLLTLLAAVLRLARLGLSPPGLCQDEATSAWNAYCLLRTGRDMAGVSWPVFYAHGFGGSPTVLLPYLMIPFQALGGLGVLTARLVPAVSGILCVPLVFYVGSRLFGRLTGSIAAALLVVNPWHFASTRWAIDGSIVPFLTLVQLAVMLAAGLPLADGEPRLRPGRALVAGVVSGIACYGYWAIRLHFPVLVALSVLLGWRWWRGALRSRAGLTAVLAFGLGLAVTFGPLAYRHLTDPDIGARGAQTRLWDPGTPPAVAARLVLARYAVHFGPEFLFVRGDRDPGNSPADSGMFEWALLPLFLVGLAAALRGMRSSASRASLVAMVLAYPAGDLVAGYDGVHAFRSSPGMAGLLLLAALGAAGAWRWLRGRNRALAWGTAAVVAVAALAQDARSMTAYFGPWRDRPAIYGLFHVDFMQACEWVRPRIRDADAVFWTTRGVNMPFVLTLVGLGYDPARWLSDPKDIRQDDAGWDYYVRYGGNYFLYGEACRPYGEAMQGNALRERAIFVVRPHELGLENPVHVIRGPDGRDRLWICEGEL